MRNAFLRLLTVVFTLSLLGGCYYTVTEKDGTSRRISHSEYRELQKNAPVSDSNWTAKPLP